MSRVTSPIRVPKGQSVVLDNVDWPMYSHLLRVFADRPRVRLTYDRGSLEIMSPLLEHEDDGAALNLMVFLLTQELNLPHKQGGSVTMRRRRAERGLEADRCFWIANAPRMAGVRRLDLRRDPPPDLAVEVDVTRSSLDRMAIYATLRVPEVWRLDGDTLTFHILNDQGAYDLAEHSLSFPLVTPPELFGFLQQARVAGDQNPVLNQFREWIRQRRADTEQASKSKRPGRRRT